MTASLSRGAQIAGGSAAALFVFMLLSWYGVDVKGVSGGLLSSVGGIDTTASAWQAFSYTDLLLFVLIVLTGVWVGALATGHERAGELRLAVMGFGGFCALIVLYRIVNQPGPNDLIKVKVGAFLGLIAIVGIAFGASQTD